MRRTSFEDMNCSVAQSLEQIGEWWTMLILRDALLGVRRFEDFQSRLGIARNILSARLETLVEHGIMERRPYSERPLRHEYVLSAKGRALWPVMTALRQWGDEWVYDADAHPIVLVHDTCGHACASVPHCSQCDEELTLRTIHVETGPGGDPDFIPARRARPGS
jgi:DNA-binding HxlR family transcriptional regulator